METDFCHFFIDQPTVRRLNQSRCSFFDWSSAPLDNTKLTYACALRPGINFAEDVRRMVPELSKCS